jgi:hypothetical protein
LKTFSIKYESLLAKEKAGRLPKDPERAKSSSGTDIQISIQKEGNPVKLLVPEKADTGSTLLPCSSLHFHM